MTWTTLSETGIRGTLEPEALLNKKRTAAQIPAGPHVIAPRVTDLSISWLRGSIARLPFEVASGSDPIRAESRSPLSCAKLTGPPGPFKEESGIDPRIAERVAPRPL